MANSSMVFDVRPGEHLDVHGIVKVELVKKSGRIARLWVTAPAEVKIEKRESKSDGSISNSKRPIGTGG